MARFEFPFVIENPSGWGPSTIPEHYKDMPYQPFSKGDRLGRVADWTGATYQDRKFINKYNSQFGNMANQYAYYHEEDESTFQLVDTQRVQKPIYQRGRVKFNQNKLKKERERRAQQQANMQVLSKTQKSRELDRQRQLRKWQKQFGRQQYDQKKIANKNLNASVTVRDTWKLVEDMDFPRLGTLRLPNVEEPEDLVKCGSLEFYDKSYDRVTTKNEKELKRIGRISHKVTTTDDPVIRKLAKSKGNVFATDAILATIMCCTKSNYSWDIVCQRIGDRLFFDKRDDSQFDLLTVSETAVEPPNEEGTAINTPRDLAFEAVYINHNFSQQVLKQDEKAYAFENSNPFVQENDEKSQEIASVGYRYRLWKLGDDIKLIARCEHDAVFTDPNGDTKFMNIKAFNEWDPKAPGNVDWRSKLDNQRGAVLATELKNNSCKLAKWTTCAMLAGSEMIKFGYVSRINMKDSRKHIILGTQQFKPVEFAQQINLKQENGWGILRCIIDTIQKLPEGKYLIMKDPAKPSLLIYDIPQNTFESEDEDSASEDYDEDDDDDDTERKPKGNEP